MKRTILLPLFAVAATSIASTLVSGVQVGAKVTPFHPHHVAGPLAGTTKCFPCTFKMRPQAQLWTTPSELDNLAPLAKLLDKRMSGEGSQFKALMLVIVDPNEKVSAESRLNSFAAKHGLKSLGLAWIESTSPDVAKYGINKQAKSTFLAYRNWEVKSNLVNIKTDEGQLKKIDSVIVEISQ